MSESTPWWKTFFHGAALDLQRALYGPQITSADADAVVALARPRPGARLLDVPCGNGRIAIELARRGFAVDGVDLTAELIDDARRAAPADHRLNWRVADMRELPGEPLYDAACCFGNSFGYLDDDGNAAFIRAVAKCLKPGGVFLMQTNLAAESILARPPQRTWYEFGDVIMLHESRHDPASSMLTSDYRFIREGAPHQRGRAHYRVYTCRQIVTMFESAGFLQVELLSGPSGTPFTTGSPVLYVRGVVGGA